MNANVILEHNAKAFRFLRTLSLFHFLLLATLFCHGQSRQLSPGDKVTKIGLVDHSKIRNSYTAFTKAKESLAKQHVTNTQLYTSSLQELQKMEEKALSLDMATGGANQEKIKQDFVVQKAALLKKYKSQQEELNLQRMNMTKAYEQKILEVINSVISQRGFTDIKPLLPNDKDQKGENITDLIIEKLNKI
jgi:Skp family chaperone for outer membrane proteins